MTRKFTDLIDWDSRNRWRTIILSIVFATVCGSVAELSGLGLVGSQIVVAGAGVSMGVAMTMNYLRVPSTDRKMRDAVSRDLRPALLTLAMASIVSACLLVLSPQIKAMVLSIRLKSVLAAEQSPFTAAKADQILRLADRSHIKLRPELVAGASAEARRLDDPKVWSEYISAVNGEVSLRSSNANTPIHQGDQLGPGKWTDSVFANETVYYRGDPVNLKNVCFYNVRLNLADNANGREFANAILSSKNNCVTISLP